MVFFYVAEIRTMKIISNQYPLVYFMVLTLTMKLVFTLFSLQAKYFLKYFMKKHPSINEEHILFSTSKPNIIKSRKMVPFVFPCLNAHLLYLRIQVCSCCAS